MQERFLRGLLDDQAAAELEASDLIADPPRGGAGARWEAYRTGYQLRLLAAIRNDYPAVERIVGPAPFEALVRRFLAAFPPSSHDISRAGDRLAGYLAGDQLTAELPFLPDLARFEAALAAAIVAADLAPLSRQALAALGDGLLDAPLALCPGTDFLASPWPLGDLWALRNTPDEEVALEVVGRPSSVVVHRDGLAVRWRETTEDEARLLTGAGRGETLSRLCDSGGFGAAEEAAPRVVTTFLALYDQAILRLSPTRTLQRVRQPGKETTE